MSLKRVEIEEKLRWRVYRNSATKVPSATPYRLIFPKIGGSQPPTKTSFAIISGTGEAMDFKFGRYIRRVHPNKSQLKILEKKERGRIQGLPVFWVPVLSAERVKLRNSNFVRTFIGSIGVKIHLNVREKYPWTYSGTLETFQGTHIQGASRGHLCDRSAFLYSESLCTR